jgi:hypothetical protein
MVTRIMALRGTAEQVGSISRISLTVRSPPPCAFRGGGRSSQPGLRGYPPTIINSCRKRFSWDTHMNGRSHPNHENR